MAKTVKYTGTQRRWPELATTGKQSVWFPGQAEERSDSEAALLIATGYFIDQDALNQTPAETATLAAMVSGGAQVGTSRSALASDSGNKLELANGVTYTLTDAVALPADVVLLGPEPGSATIAVTGTATANGTTSNITISAGQVASIISRPSNPAKFVVKVS